MTKIDIPVNFLQYVFLLYNPDTIKCSICGKIPDKLYMICKPSCTKYSYCKQCVENIEKLYHECPFTKTSFLTSDIGLDYRNNEILEIFKIYSKNNIKTINFNILFNV